MGGGPVGRAALPAVTSQGAEGERLAPRPSRLLRVPGVGSVGPREMPLPPAVRVAEHAAASPRTPPP